MPCEVIPHVSIRLIRTWVFRGVLSESEIILIHKSNEQLR